MKTYLLGALFGILLLLGVTLLYGVDRHDVVRRADLRLGQAPAGAVAVGVVGVVAGLMFKAGGVPGALLGARRGAGRRRGGRGVPHHGAQDRCAGRRVPTGATPSPRPSAGRLLVAVLAVASMTLGNLAAYWQDDPRRLLGWSTVSQVGYLLVPVAVAGPQRPGAAVPAGLPRRLHRDQPRRPSPSTTALPGPARPRVVPWAVRRHPWLGGRAGRGAARAGRHPADGGLRRQADHRPPRPGTAVPPGWRWWSFVNTVVSLFYYLRWIAPVYRLAGSSGDDLPVAVAPGVWSATMATVAAAASLAMGLGAGVLWASVS